MTKEEFLKRIEEDEEWCPGWEAIEKEFSRLYPEQNPIHYGTNFVSRVRFGGDEYLDGYSIYSSEKGYKHIVTFGMTELYADEKSFGNEWNKWGYEMTIKLKEDNAEDCLWAINMLSNLARYTYTTKKFFEPYQYVQGSGTSLHIGIDSDITALLLVSDTEANTQTSVYGKTEVIQLVGITEAELEAIKESSDNTKILIEKMKEDNPDLITDMLRKKSYFWYIIQNICKYKKQIQKLFVLLNRNVKIKLIFVVYAWFDMIKMLK